jgi:hypothetical protein
MTPRITLNKIEPGSTGFEIRTRGYIDIDASNILFTQASEIAHSANRNGEFYVRFIPDPMTIRIFVEMGFNAPSLKEMIQWIVAEVERDSESNVNEHLKFVTKVEENNITLERLVDDLRVEDELATGVYD